MNNTVLFLINVTAAFGMSYAVSLHFAAKQRQIGRERQKLETCRLLRAEFMYWRDFGDAGDADDTQRTIALGATGAVSNVLAAVMDHPAPWHRPDHEPKASIAP